MKSAKSHFLFPILASLVLFGVSSPSALAAKNVSIKGSDTMVNLGQAWAEAFMEQYPDQMLAVTGGGSGTGISSIISGTCDIAQSSRSMTAEEIQKAAANGHKLKEVTVAYDGIAVVVNPANPISQLTIGQLSDIFTGKVTNWSEIGGKNEPILALSRERNSGTHIFFLEHVLRKGNAKGPEEFSSNALMMPSSQAIMQEVERSSAAISYVGLGYVSPKVKVIAVASSPEGPFETPSLITVQDGTYTVSRPLYFYIQENSEPVIQQLVDFVLSDKGQEIVQLLDFVPLSKQS